MADKKGGKKGRKIGRNKVCCARFRAEGRCERNKSRRAGGAKALVTLRETSRRGWHEDFRKRVHAWADLQLEWARSVLPPKLPKKTDAIVAQR